MGDDGIFRRPAVPQPVRIRRDINHLAPDDPTVVWYERAIKAMQALPLENPLSWRYQAAIHDYPTDTSSVEARKKRSVTWDPLAVEEDRMPSQKDQNTYWRQCQHAGWFFIPWHRMYIHFFEKIVADLIVSMDGPANWALPYWNYSASSAAALLPEPFRSQTIPSTGERNALWVLQRTPNANKGLPFLDLAGPLLVNPAKPETNLQCLQDLIFSTEQPPPAPTQPPAPSQFGGSSGRTHGRRSGFGSMEGTPHGTVHTTLGGLSPDRDPDKWLRDASIVPPGYMTLFTTAPLDPMFWLHHCNIDRLWEVWVQRRKTRGILKRNPKLPDWLSGTDATFDFHDAKGQETTMNTKAVLDTRQAPLSYEYEDTSDPLPGTP